MESIAKSTLEQLEFPKILDEIKKYAVTDIGRSEIDLLKPFEDRNILNAESGFVTEAKEIIIKLDIPPFDYLPDLKDTIRRCSVEGTILTIKQINDIIKLAKISRKLYQYLKSYSPDAKLFVKFSDELFIDKLFEHQISSVFTESGDIRDNASDKLRDIRRQIIDKTEKLRKSVHRILKKLSESFLVQEEYVTLRDGRIVVPVKAEHKRHVRGFIHSESSSGQTVYIEPEETLDLNNEILSLSFAEKREIERILKTITAKIGMVHSQLTSSLIILGKIDAIFAKARYSIEIMGNFPSIDKNQPFTIINGKHPLLIRKLKHENTIPLNVKITNQNVILITGPNAGGKTVVLKTIGLLSLMVSAALHVPVDPDSNFRIYNNILLDIGDQQSIEDDLSTFSSHLRNIDRVIRESDHNTLVLLDEIGTGTDPSEGSALATAILIRLQKQGAMIFATTHHGNLKVVANELDGFENASMLFDSHELKPTYIFSQGMPGSSYAFEVAKRIGLDESLINSANQYLDSGKSKVEEFLLDLEKKSNSLKEKLSFYERENSRLKGLMNLYSEKIKKLENEKTEILKKAKAEADIYLGDVNRQVESAIKNIRESQAEKSVIKQEKQKISKLKEKTKDLVRKYDSAEQKTSEKLTVGDFVKIQGTETIGLLSEINGKQAVIISGSVKVRAKLESLEFSSKRESTHPVRSKYNISTQLASLRLDIRGQKPEEAEFEVIRYLDDAYRNDIKNVEILHGKGTGALKKTVQEILGKHEAVKDFYYAKIEFGGEGITIVELN